MLTLGVGENVTQQKVGLGCPPPIGNFWRQKFGEKGKRTLIQKLHRLEEWQASAPVPIPPEHPEEKIPPSSADQPKTAPRVPSSIKTPSFGNHRWLQHNHPSCSTSFPATVRPQAPSWSPHAQLVQPAPLSLPGAGLLQLLWPTMRGLCHSDHGAWSLPPGHSSI